MEKQTENDICTQKRRDPWAWFIRETALNLGPDTAWERELPRRQMDAQPGQTLQMLC